MVVECSAKLGVSTIINAQHDDAINDAQVDQTGKYLATCSSDYSIKIFEMIENSHNLITTLSSHSGPVWQVSWGPPKYGFILASCSFDKRVIVWKQQNNSSWTKLHEFSHESSVNSTQWYPSDQELVLVSASQDGSISVLTSINENNNTWNLIKIPEAHFIGCLSVSWCQPLEFTRQKELVISKRFVSGGTDELVKIWRFDQNESSWNEEFKLIGHGDNVRSVAWCPDVGSSISKIASCSQDGKVIVWTFDIFKSDGWIAEILKKYDEPCWHVSWSPNGTTLVVSYGDNKFSLWKQSIENKWFCLNE